MGDRGDWGGEEGGGRARVGRDGNVVGGDGVGGGVDAGGRECRRGREEGRGHLGGGGGRRVSGRQGCQAFGRFLACLGHLVESASLTSPQLDTLLIGLSLWGRVGGRGEGFPFSHRGKWTRPKEGLRRGARMTDILGPAKFA